VEYVTDSSTETLPRRRHLSRTGWGVALLALSVVGTLGLAAVPAPYVIEMPGPVYDTLSTASDGDGNDVPLISIDGVETYPTAGTLSLLTVYVGGSPDDHPTWLEVISAWFRPAVAVVSEAGKLFSGLRDFFAAAAREHSDHP
jgi:PDZ domain-containing protein